MDDTAQNGRKPDVTDDVSRYMRELGKLGGRARAASMTAQERADMSRKAAVKRWRAERKKKREKSS